MEDEGGDAEDLSPSLCSVSSAEADAAELLRDKTHVGEDEGLAPR